MEYVDVHDLRWAYIGGESVPGAESCIVIGSCGVDVASDSACGTNVEYIDELIISTSAGYGLRYAVMTEISSGTDFDNSSNSDGTCNVPRLMSRLAHWFLGGAERTTMVPN